MKIFLLRHAIAEDMSLSGMDSDRALTPTGIQRLERVLQVASQSGVEPEAIVSSPYLRAKQTAEHAATHLQCPHPILFSDALVPHASPAEAWADIRTLATATDADSILVVSHDPLISSLLSYLLGVAGFVHSFKKAGLARIDLSRVGAHPNGELQWILTPALASATVHPRDS